MDISAALALEGLSLDDLDKNEPGEFNKIYFVYNLSGADLNEVQNDFTMSYFDNIHNLRYGVVKPTSDEVKSRQVVSCGIENLEVLDLIIKSKELFGIQPILMLGFPGSQSDSVFESIFFNENRISYDHFMETLEFVKEVNSEFADASAGIYEKEKALYTRKDGTVREYSPEIDDGDVDDGSEL